MNTSRTSFFLMSQSMLFVVGKGVDEDLIDDCTFACFSVRRCALPSFFSVFFAVFSAPCPGTCPFAFLRLSRPLPILAPLNGSESGAAPIFSVFAQATRGGRGEGRKYAHIAIVGNQCRAGVCLPLDCNEKASVSITHGLRVRSASSLSWQCNTSGSHNKLLTVCHRFTHAIASLCIEKCRQERTRVSSLSVRAPRSPGFTPHNHCVIWTAHIDSYRSICRTSVEGTTPIVQN